MKNLRYILLLALSMSVLNTACVKSSWDAPAPRTIAAPNEFVTSLDENFNSVSLVDGQYLLPPQGWCNIGRNGNHRAFQTSVIANSDNKKVQCVTATAYLALGDATDAWLITPPLKIVAGAAFTYTAALAYNNNSRADVEVRCYSTSSANTVAPSLENLDGWTVIETLSAKDPYSITSGTGAVTWFCFYPQSHVLSSYSNAADDVMYVAFRYAIPKVSSSNSWYFDDVKYNK